MWELPGPAGDLRLGGGSHTLLAWSAPSDPGATAWTYDVLRSDHPQDFTAASCLASGTTLPSGAAPDEPDGLFCYLVRVGNGCAANMGSDSGGAARPPRAVPSTSTRNRRCGQVSYAGGCYIRPDGRAIPGVVWLTRSHQGRDQDVPREGRVRDLDLVVPGSICGFIGPNGAGKTTTLRMIMSIIFPTPASSRSWASAPRGVEGQDRLPAEERGLTQMTVGTFLAYMARIKGDEGADLVPRVKKMLARVGIADVYYKKCEELSKGMHRRSIPDRHDPRSELLILDEPFSGLDPVARACCAS